MIRQLFRSRTNRQLGGVCGGLAAYFGVDPTVIRLLAVAAAFLTCSTAVLCYIAAWIIMPEEP